MNRSGNPNPVLPGGRPKGTLNKTTGETKEVIKKLLESNHDNMSIWLEKVASTDPAKALDLMFRLIDFVVPKLARQELTGANGDPLINPDILTLRHLLTNNVQPPKLP